MSFFNAAFNGIDAGVEALFSIDNIALWFAFGLLAWCGWIILANGRRHYRPFRHQLALRLDATDFIEDSEDRATAQAAFATAFPHIDAVMATRGTGADGLRHAWAQFRESLLDPAETPLIATARPESYFLHLGDETRVLAWWANIFVAIGLTFTFLGIVAALLKAVQAMGASADPANMQVALIGLLHITAAKFWTSIGGVLSSIILRVFDRRWHSASQRGLERLCDRLETGTRFVSPQRLAADQLLELRRHGDLLERNQRGSAKGKAAAAAAGEDGGEQLATAARLLSSVAERLALALDGLGGQVDQVMERASSGIDEMLGSVTRRATDATQSQAETLEATNRQVQAMLSALTQSIGESTAVFTPLREAARSIERSITTTQEMLDALRQRTQRSEEAMEKIVSGLEETSSSATRAWHGYQERFDNVDASLGTALVQIHSATTEHAGLLTQQIGRIDIALAQAVDRLSGALTVIGDLVAVLDDMRGETGAAR